MCPKRRGTQPRTPARRVPSVVYLRCNIFEHLCEHHKGPSQGILRGVRVTEGHRGAPKVTEVCPGCVPAVSRLCPGVRHA